MIDMANIGMQLHGRTRYGIKFVRKEEYGNVDKNSTGRKSELREDDTI